MRSPVRSKIDDRIHALIVMEVGCRELPEYSLGDILYSALRRVAKANGGIIDQSISDEIELNNNDYNA
mgnify:CR=1 FL=1